MLFRSARYHNIFGPEGTWEGGREKSPAAICRKVAYLPEEGGTIEVWGDGLQTRSFLYIDGPLGVRGRNSNNDLIREKLGWDYSQTLEEGIGKTYNWIKEQING